MADTAANADYGDKTAHADDNGGGVNVFELTEAEQRKLRRVRLTKAAAGHLSLRDLTAEVHRLSQPDTVDLTRLLQKNANAPAPAIAQGVRAKLASINTDGATEVLHDALHYAVRTTSRTRSLGADELAALLAADGPQLGFLVDYPLRDALVAGPEEFGVSVGVRAAVWSSMICSGHEGAIAALAWLVAEPPEFWNDTQRSTVAAVWAQVHERLELPGRPASLDALCEVVADLERSGEIDSLAAATHPAADHHDSAIPPTPELLDQLAERVVALQERYNDVRDGALTELNMDMAAGHVPSATAIDAVVGLAHDMIAALTAVASATASVAVDTLDQAREDLEIAVAAHTAADVLGRVASLTGLHGPEYIAEEVRQVGALAAAADDGTDPAILAALDALVTAIDLAGSDAQRATDLVRIVQTALPSAAVLVMLAGTPGTLTLHTAKPAASIMSSDRVASEMSLPASSEPTTELEAATDSVSGLLDTYAMNEEEASAETREAGVSTDTQPNRDTASEATDDVVKVRSVVCDDKVGQTPVDADKPVVNERNIEEILADLDLTLPNIDETLTPATPRNPVQIAAEGISTPKKATKPDESLDTEQVDTGALYASLMGAHQYALAGWLSESIGAPAAATSAHRLAAHAVAIRTSTGPNAATFKDLVAELDAEALRDLPGLQMLLYAASVRAGLLSPTAGAADPLRDMCPAIVKSGPAIEEMTDALLTCIYAGAYLTQRSSNAVAEVANLESDCVGLVDTARSMIDTASSRNIRYAAATTLYKTWMESNGYLGSALSLVASGVRRPDDIKFVRKRATELRSRGEVESAINRDTPAPHARRVRRIEARARDKLIEWAGDVADVLAQWVEATENIAQATSTGWMAGQINELRSRVTTLRADASAELVRLGGFDLDTRDVAIDAGVELLESSLDLLTIGTQLSADLELSADRVSNGVLALSASLPLSVDPTLRPLRRVTITDIHTAATSLGAENAGWTTAFNRRAELSDHVGTQVIIDMLRGADSQLARRLSAIRERDVAGAADRINIHVAELASRIDSDRRFGRLSADAWSALSVQTRAFETDSRGSRRDFDVMETNLSIIEERREKQVASTIEAKWQQLADLQSTLAPTDEQAGRISDCIVAEDITTADEYIETIRSRGELPGPRGDVDHLARFFPAFPAMFAAAVDMRAPHALGELKRAVDAGCNPQSGFLADVLAGAQIDIASINRRPAVSSRLEQWTNLTAARTLDAKLPQIKPILEQLGFFAVKASIPNPRKGRVPRASSWMHLSGVRGTEGEALIPAFGSKISPTGETLRVLALWGSPTPGRLVELLRDEPADHAVLILYFGTLSVDARRELATLMRSGPRLPTTAVVDDAAFAYLSVQPTPRRDTAMAITLPFASSAPFTPDVAGLVPVEMFYGRTNELDQVINMMGSCIVYGGRQLGKSALLRAAARKFDAGENRKAIYQSIYNVGQGTISADKVWTTLWPRLAEKRIVPNEDLPIVDVAATAIRHITSWTNSVPGRQLLLLLDESDFFLDADAREGSKFTHVAAFRELMESTERAVKVVFAGLHQTARFERLANHPLAHFGDPVCVGPLPPQHAYDLLTDPLRALGYRFTDDNVAARVLALANNQPSLIQLFGAKLLTYLQRSGTPATLPQRATADDIETVWSDESLREAFRKRFDWTLNLDPRYKIIAYTVAYHAHAHGVGSALTPTDLRSQCEQWWPQGFAAEDIRTGEFRALLDECVALGVLSYSPAEGAYRLRTPNVLALLGSRDEVDDVLDAAESTPLPESFDGSLLRPVFAGSVTCSPLTSAQIADLLTTRSQVRVIAGSDALTVSRCSRVLRDENERAVYGARAIPIKEATVGNLENVCQTAAMTAANGHVIVIVDLRPVSHTGALSAWSRAREAIAAPHSGTLGIVLIAGPEQGPLWVSATVEADASSSLTALHRYDNTGLRLWSNEISVPFQDDASRAELLAVSGGWPMLVNRVAEASSVDKDTDARASALDDLRTWLANPAHADEFVDALGVRTDDVLRAAWEFLLTALSDDAADAPTLAELMTIAASEEAFVALRTDRLEAGGYGNTAAVVDLLRGIGVLVVSADDGQLRLEPVAAAAAKTANSARG